METLNEGSVKFVLENRTYDTATSTAVAVSRGVTVADSIGTLPPGAETERYEKVLYRTRLGNFFVHDHTTTKFGRGKPVVEDSAYIVSAAKAVVWIQQWNAMVLDPSGLSLPEEG
jgi:hypothetical protein